MEDKNDMSRLRRISVGGGKLLRYFPHIVKCRGKIVTPAPLAPTANHNFAAHAVAFGLFVLAAAPFILATPVHGYVDITVDPSVQLKHVSYNDLYEATTRIMVMTDYHYGFNLTMKAYGSSDLINSQDNSRRIKSLPLGERSEYPSSNQWGYSSSVYGIGFHGIPNGDQTGTSLVNTSKYNKGSCDSITSCHKDITFAAKVDPKLASGSYSTKITYTVTANPASDLTVCKSGDPKNDCQVDLDPNMIPVKYTGTTTNAQWTSLANPEDSYNQGNWYNYNRKRWANAVTVKDPSKYKGKDMVVDQSDILGYWVYIPRYAYEVMRRDGTDRPVRAWNFDIIFEKANTPKKRPAACRTGKNNDYRGRCRLDRDYAKNYSRDNGTWATHPAFTFGNKELNGIWFAKFEMTGSSTQPTILPNERAMSWDSAVEFIGNKYVTATTLGIKDPQNTGGNNNFTPPAQNSHHLAELSSRMPKNTDWGAVAYLSASQFGAGYNGVKPNAAMAYSKDAKSCDSKFAGSEHRCSRDITGCGPITKFNIRKVYVDPGDYGQQSACSKSNLQRAYNGTLGQLASTTNNPTGVYDMAGGGWEYVAASYTDDTSLTNSSTETEHKYMLTPAHKPYVDLYNFDTFAKCTWATCGGQATYEVINGKYNNGHGSWNGVASFAPRLHNNKKEYWAGRGRSVWDIINGRAAGLFNSGSFSGHGVTDSSLRVVLSSRPV